MGAQCFGFDCDWDRFLVALKQSGLQPVWILLTALVSFVSAWILFELTERRKVRLAQKALREALIAELRHAEVLLSSIVGKYAHLANTPEEVASTAKELRWFVEADRQRGEEVGLGGNEVPPEFPERIMAYSDDQIVAAFARPQGRRETVGTKLILPIVEAALAGRTAGFSSDEIQTISTVRWQLHLLEQDADWTAEFFRLTFTVADEENHALIRANHENRVRSYARRAGVVLRCVRTTIVALLNH
jgi:hypothetical protein